MTVTAEENDPEIELCHMVAPPSAIIKFLERHGEYDYGFEYDSDGTKALYVRGVREADWNDTLVWRRGGRVIVAKEREVPFIEGQATLMGLVSKAAHGGRVVSYWPTDRTVIADAAPIESKTAALQWMTRHPVEGMRLVDRKDGGGTKRPTVKMPGGKEYPRRHWLIWTKDGGVQDPVDTAKWKAIRGSLIRSGVSFRQMFEGAELGFERKNTGVN